MNILLVGCGRMGAAMARAWLPEHRVMVFDPAAPVPDGGEMVETLDADFPAGLVVVLAVKPQVFHATVSDFAVLATKRPLFVSIMAGVTLASLGDALGRTGRTVRAMPNTPAAIGRGITAAVRGAGVDDADAAMAERLLCATGELVWLDDEGELDAVTAVSGSGPAYFYRFAEALASAGAEAGLDPALAMRLARATFTGSAALAERDEAGLDELRRQVTSPGGTTAAGLSILDADDAIDRLTAEVVAAAAARSRELAG